MCPCPMCSAILRCSSVWVLVRCFCSPKTMQLAREQQTGRGIVRLDESWLLGAIRAKEPSRRVTCKQHAIILSLSVEENSKQRIVALCLLTRLSNRAQAGSMMSADYQYSATLTPTRSSNHPLICKIRSRSTAVCWHMRPQCVALEYGLGEAHNAASSQYLP
jgi:hypothetical protein